MIRRFERHEGQRPGDEMNRHRILIVEDEPNVRLVFRMALESSDYRITVAADGEAALAWLAQEHFDVVLLDLQMPGTGGMDVLARLRERRDNTPVVIISAHDRVPNVVQAMKLGAIDFLAKPLTPDALRRAVAEVLARQEEGDPTGKFEQGAGRPRSLLMSAKCALNHRLFKQAGVLLREAIKEEPRSAEPRYLLGVVREVEGRPEAAAEAYRDALRVDPHFEPAKLHLLKYQGTR
jgi:DNA-binding NtrC family response regulator